MGLLALKTRGRLYLLIVCAVIFTLIAFNDFFKVSRVVCVPITFTLSGTPALLATIEDNECLLELDLGSKFQLSLKKSILDGINDKKAHKMAHWKDAKGDSYESPSYLIPNVSIGDLVLADVIARQESDIYRQNTTLWNDQDKKDVQIILLGSIGRPLLEKTNLLLDFPHSKMIACNSKYKLKRLGIYLENMTKIPFEGGERGIIIKTDTDAGILRLGLDTGATITLIRSSRLHDQKCTIDEHGFSTYTTSKLSIGNADFGSKDLFLYDITSELHEIDGVLGMDFLKDHVIYIDYQEKMIYIL